MPASGAVPDPFATYEVLTTAGGTEPIVIFGEWTSRPRWFRRLFAWAASIRLRPRSSPRVPMSVSVLSPDAYPMDAKSDFCWRCDSVPAADDLGLCVPCRLDLE